MILHFKDHRRGFIVAAIVTALICALIIWTDWQEHCQRRSAPLPTTIITESTQPNVIKITRATALREAGIRMRMEIESRAADGSITVPANEAEAIAVLNEQLKSGRREIDGLKKSIMATSIWIASHGREDQ